MPKLLKDQVVQDDARYRGFDGGEEQDLAAASGRMQPVMQERHMSMMIADVKGFTKLTEILSKKGGRTRTGGTAGGGRGQGGGGPFAVRLCAGMVCGRGGQSINPMALLGTSA